MVVHCAELSEGDPNRRVSEQFPDINIAMHK
jgi:hypothetical protein